MAIEGVEDIDKQPPNLIEDFEACLEAVMSIEQQVKPNISGRTQDAIREGLYRARERLLTWRQHTPEEKFKSYRPNVSGFEGVDGFNRYGVKADGSLSLDRYHSVSACIQRAQELGIETPDY